MSSIDFGGQRWRSVITYIEMTMWTSMMYPKLLCASSSNLANMLTMVRGWPLLILEDSGQEKKGRDLTQSYDKKTLYHQNCQKGNMTTQRPHQKVRLHCDCGPTWDGKMEGVTTVIQLVWLTCVRAQPSHSPQQPCNQKNTHLKIDMHVNMI